MVDLRDFHWCYEILWLMFLNVFVMITLCVCGDIFGVWFFVYG